MTNHGSDKRREYLAAGATSLKKFERTGIAYAMDDVEKYILAIAAGKKPRRPRPAIVGRKKP
jgi:hypothetical protein